MKKNIALLAGGYSGEYVISIKTAETIQNNLDPELYSTYKIVVGRSEKIQGPYVDKEGVPMNQGGGSTVLEGDKNWHGVGHSAVAGFDGTDYLIFHAYDAADKGRPKLRIEKINWVNEWPVVDQEKK